MYYKIYGIELVDYQKAYKNFGNKKLEKYTLDYVAYSEIGQKKVDYSEFLDLDELYEKDFQKFIDYNLKDVILINEIDAKKKIITFGVNRCI